MIMKECPVCKRKVREDDITHHHYIPQCAGGTIQDTISLCQTCHRMLHYLIPLSQVTIYNTIEKLLECELMFEYIEWIRTKNHPHQYPVKKVLYYMRKYQLVA